MGTTGRLELTGSDSAVVSFFGYRVDTEREVLALVGAVCFGLCPRGNVWQVGL